MPSPAAAAAAPVVYRRSTPRALHVAVWGLLLIPCATLPALISALFDGPLPFADWAELFGRPALVGSLIGLWLLPFSLLFALVAWARRRYGHVLVHGDQLEFRFALSPPWVTVILGVEQLSGRHLSPGGVLFEPAQRGRYGRLAFPLFVPVEGEEAQAQLLAHLDRLAPAPDEEQAFGRPYPTWLVLALASGVWLLALPPAGLVMTRLGFDWGVPAVLLFSLLQLPPMILFEQGWLQPRYRTLHVGREALVVSERRLPYRELTCVTQAGPYLALESGRRRFLIRLDDELPAALESLAGRLAQRELPLAISSPPSWATPRTRRRRAFGALALAALAAAISWGLACSNPPLYDYVYAADQEGAYARLVYRISDGKPRLLVLLDDAPGVTTYVLADHLRLPQLGGELVLAAFNPETVEIDLVDGQGSHPRTGWRPLPASATWVGVDAEGAWHVAEVELPAGLTGALRDHHARLDVPSLRSELRPVLSEVDDPAVRAWLASAPAAAAANR